MLWCMRYLLHRNNRGHCLPPLPVVMWMTQNMFDSTPWFQAPKLTWLDEYLWNTFTAKIKWEKQIVLVCWPLTQWPVSQVSTPCTCPLSATHIHFDSRICSWTLTLTLHLTLTQTSAELCRLLGYNSCAIDSSMTAHVWDPVKKSRIYCG